MFAYGLYLNIELASNCQTSRFLQIISRIGAFLRDKIKNAYSWYRPTGILG